MLTNLTRRVYAAWHNAGVPFSPATMEKLMTKPTHAETHFSVWQDTGACFSEAAVDWNDHSGPGCGVIRRYEYSDGSAIVVSEDYIDFAVHDDHRTDALVIDCIQSAIVESEAWPNDTPFEYVGLSDFRGVEHFAYPAQD